MSSQCGLTALRYPFPIWKKIPSISSSNPQNYLNLCRFHCPKTFFCLWQVCAQFAFQRQTLSSRGTPHNFPSPPLVSYLDLSSLPSSYIGTVLFLTFSLVNKSSIVNGCLCWQLPWLTVLPHYSFLFIILSHRSFIPPSSGISSHFLYASNVLGVSNENSSAVKCAKPSLVLI